MPGFRH